METCQSCLPAFPLQLTQGRAGLGVSCCSTHIVSPTEPAARAKAGLLLPSPCQATKSLPRGLPADVCLPARLLNGHGQWHLQERVGKTDELCLQQADSTLGSSAEMTLSGQVLLWVAVTPTPDCTVCSPTLQGLASEGPFLTF